MNRPVIFLYLHHHAHHCVLWRVTLPSQSIQTQTVSNATWCINEVFVFLIQILMFPLCFPCREELWVGGWLDGFDNKWSKFMAEDVAGWWWMGGGCFTSENVGDGKKHVKVRWINIMRDQHTYMQHSWMSNVCVYNW